MISPEADVRLRELESALPDLLDAYPVRDSFLKNFNRRVSAIRAVTHMAEHSSIEHSLLKILRSHGFQIEYP